MPYKLIDNDDGTFGVITVDNKICRYTNYNLTRKHALDVIKKYNKQHHPNLLKLIDNDNGTYDIVEYPNCVVHSYNSTKENAKSQIRLLRAIEHGWTPGYRS